MPTYNTQLFLNPQAQDPKPYGPPQQDLLNQQALAHAKAEITSWPNYAPAPRIPRENRAPAPRGTAQWCK